MFNIKNIINIIINNFFKNIITIKKNYRFDLKGKIKNYYYCCCCCRRRRYFYYYYD
jgi:hypothetical protein